MKIEREKIEQYLKKFPVKPCALCGQKDWTVLERPFSLIEYAASTLGMSYQYVTIPIACNNCGNTLLISARVAGLIEPPKEVQNE